MPELEAATAAEENNKEHSLEVMEPEIEIKGRTHMVDLADWGDYKKSTFKHRVHGQRKFILPNPSILKPEEWEVEACRVIERDLERLDRDGENFKAELLEWYSYWKVFSVFKSHDQHYRFISRVKTWKSLLHEVLDEGLADSLDEWKQGPVAEATASQGKPDKRKYTRRTPLANQNEGTTYGGEFENGARYEAPKTRGRGRPRKNPVKDESQGPVDIDKVVPIASGDAVLPRLINALESQKRRRTPSPKPRSILGKANTTRPAGIKRRRVTFRVPVSSIRPRANEKKPSEAAPAETEDGATASKDEDNGDMDSEDEGADRSISSSPRKQVSGLRLKSTIVDERVLDSDDEGDVADNSTSYASSNQTRCSADEEDSCDDDLDGGDSIASLNEVPGSEDIYSDEVGHDKYEETNDSIVEYSDRGDETTDEQITDNEDADSKTSTPSTNQVTSKEDDQHRASIEMNDSQNGDYQARKQQMPNNSKAGQKVDKSRARVDTDGLKNVKREGYESKPIINRNDVNNSQYANRGLRQSIEGNDFTNGQYVGYQPTESIARNSMNHGQNVNGQPRASIERNNLNHGQHVSYQARASIERNVMNSGQYMGYQPRASMERNQLSNTQNVGYQHGILPARNNAQSAPNVQYQGYGANPARNNLQALQYQGYGNNIQSVQYQGYGNNAQNVQNQGYGAYPAANNMHFAQPPNYQPSAQPARRFVSNFSGHSYDPPTFIARNGLRDPQYAGYELRTLPDMTTPINGQHSQNGQYGNYGSYANMNNSNDFQYGNLGSRARSDWDNSRNGW